MKRKVDVVITSEIELEIKDECLTPEFIAAFETSFHELNPYDEFENDVDALFAFAARQVAMRGDNQFIEGLGDCFPKWKAGDPNVRVNSTDEDCEEIIRA